MGKVLPGFKGSELPLGSWCPAPFCLLLPFLLLFHFLYCSLPVPAAFAAGFFATVPPLPGHMGRLDLEWRREGWGSLRSRMTTEDC